MSVNLANSLGAPCRQLHLITKLGYMSMRGKSIVILSSISFIVSFNNAVWISFDICMSYRPLISYDLGHRTAHAPHKFVTSRRGHWPLLMRYVSSCVEAQVVWGGRGKKYVFCYVLSIGRNIIYNSNCKCKSTGSCICLRRHIYMSHVNKVQPIPVKMLRIAAIRVNMYMSDLRHIHHPVLSSLKMEGIRHNNRTNNK
jgi:hypothetical protein